MKPPRPPIGASANTPKPKLGSGKRFDQLTEALSRRGNVQNPKALAASIGRKKYGKAKFQGLAAKGKAGD